MDASLNAPADVGSGRCGRGRPDPAGASTFDQRLWQACDGVRPGGERPGRNAQSSSEDKPVTGMPAYFDIAASGR